jgi:hypothetical protein
MAEASALYPVEVSSYFEHWVAGECSNYNGTSTDRFVLVFWVLPLFLFVSVAMLGFVINHAFYRFLSMGAILGELFMWGASAAIPAHLQGGSCGSSATYGRACDECAITFYIFLFCLAYEIVAHHGKFGKSLRKKFNEHPKRWTSLLPLFLVSTTSSAARIYFGFFNISQVALALLAGGIWACVWAVVVYCLFAPHFYSPWAKTLLSVLLLEKSAFRWTKPKPESLAKK